MVIEEYRKWENVKIRKREIDVPLTLTSADKDWGLVILTPVTEQNKDKLIF